jgi:hypothetical protein
MMSKRTNRFLTLLFVAALATAGLLASHSSGAAMLQQANVAKGVPKSNARSAAVVAATTEVLKETSEIRELAILKPVKSSAQSRSEIEHMLIKNLNDQMTTAEMHATEVSLRKFGLAPPEFEYRPFIIKLLTEQVAGYYDPKEQQFHLADWLDLEGQKPVMAHELTHALQDQHFNLRRFEKWPHGDADAELAAHALVEGDATLAMTIYMAKNPLVALAFSRSLTTGVATEQYDQAPRALRESLIFPYLQGSEWATQLYRRGGWTMVSNAFNKLPLSSEQILHAEKYFNYERPVKIVLPDVTNLLNGRSSQTTDNKEQAVDKNEEAAETTRGGDAGTHTISTAAAARIKSRRAPLPKRREPPPNGSVSNGPVSSRPVSPSAWRRIDSDVSGEWTYYLILDQFLNSTAESKRAAAGWGGDRYALYEGPNGHVFLVQVTAWDTENDAREFFAAYVKRTELRYPGAKRINSSDSEPETQDSKLETRNSYSWQTSDGGVVLELRGQRVVILEGIPQGIDAETLVKTLGQY